MLHYTVSNTVPEPTASMFSPFAAFFLLLDLHQVKNELNNLKTKSYLKLPLKNFRLISELTFERKLQGDMFQFVSW